MMIYITKYPSIIKELSDFAKRESELTVNELKESELGLLINSLEKPCLNLFQFSKLGLDQSAVIIATKIAVLAGVVSIRSCWNNLDQRLIEFAEIVASTESSVTRMTVRGEKIGKHYKELLNALENSKIIYLDITGNQLGSDAPFVVSQCSQRWTPKIGQCVKV